MTDRVHARLLILAVLVMSLVGTLVAKAFSMQVLADDTARTAAQDNRQRQSLIPPARGLILDQYGRALAVNRIGLDVAVDRGRLRALDDDGRAVVAELAALLGLRPGVVTARLQNCGTPGARAQPNCWNGPPAAEPVVARDIDADLAGRIMADPQGFPGVSVQQVPVRVYPRGAQAAHTVGYVGRVPAEALAEDPRLEGVSAVGRAGLERLYDEALRGRPGREQATIDSSGNRTVSGIEVPGEPGMSLVTHIDAELQAVVERQLRAAMRRARAQSDPVWGRAYQAEGGAAVVLDVRTGAVLALASAPGYDANLWVGGISSMDYAALTAPDAHDPLLNRAVQTAVAPASTFKPFTTLAALAEGYSTTATYGCPAQYSVGEQSFTNFRSQAFGDITLRRALEVSCDTVFYRIAHEQWRADGGSDPVPNPADAVSTVAAAFGFGRPTGIDLPGETAGRLAGRSAKREQWDRLRAQWCRRAAGGYPELADRERAEYLTALAQENCTEGMRWRAGDAINAAIGQGDTAATVLQVATAYAALANGGTVYRPRVARALLHADGSVAQRFEPQRLGSVPVPLVNLRFLRRALRGAVDAGTGRSSFESFPTEVIPIAGKTGTAEVFGEQTTSWFASFAPADEPRYAVVMMVSQSGTGSGAAGPGVAGIYEALFGVDDGTPDPGRSVLVGGDVAADLPRIGPDGVPQPPPTRSGPGR